MSDAPEPKDLDELQAKIDALKVKEDGPKVEEHYSQAQHAWRMVIELVSGLGIGFVMGYGIDWVLGGRENNGPYRTGASGRKYSRAEKPG